MIELSPLCESIRITVPFEKLYYHFYLSKNDNVVLHNHFYVVLQIGLKLAEILKQKVYSITMFL